MLENPSLLLFQVLASAVVQVCRKGKEKRPLRFLPAPSSGCLWTGQALWAPLHSRAVPGAGFSLGTAMPTPFLGANLTSRLKEAEVLMDSNGAVLILLGGRRAVLKREKAVSRSLALPRLFWLSFLDIPWGHSFRDCNGGRNASPGMTSKAGRVCSRVPVPPLWNTLGISGSALPASRLCQVTPTSSSAEELFGEHPARGGPWQWEWGWPMH